MKFYTSVSTSTRGQARRVQNLLSSPKSPVHIVRSDAEKGWERIARTYALETYSIPWCEYWPFLNTYIDLSSIDGLRLLEYYLQQRVLHSQILKTIVHLEKFSSQYLSIDQSQISNEHDLVLNSISQLIQIFYSVIDLLNLNDFTLNRYYRCHVESSGYHNQQNNDLHDLKTNAIEQLQWLAKENQHLLSLFTRPLLNSLTMVFTLLISPSGCALIDQIQYNQYERRPCQQTIRPASRLSLIGLVCSKRRQQQQQTRSSHSSSHSLIRSNSWPHLLTSPIDSSISRRCRSQIFFAQNNNYHSSLNSLNDTTTTSVHDFRQQSLSTGHMSSMLSSQTSVDMFREDRNKIDKWHYFLAG
jgi:hypothetical protein